MARCSSSPGSRSRSTAARMRQPGDATRVGVSYHDLWRDVNAGDVLLLDDGLISLEVLDVEERRIHCSVI